LFGGQFDSRCRTNSIIVIDARFNPFGDNHLVTYRNPEPGKWLGPVENRKDSPESTHPTTLRNLARAGISPLPETRSALREHKFRSSGALFVHSLHE